LDRLFLDRLLVLLDRLFDCERPPPLAFAEPFGAFGAAWVDPDDWVRWPWPDRPDRPRPPRRRRRAPDDPPGREPPPPLELLPEEPG
jgi:hypothetical protein